MRRGDCCRSCTKQYDGGLAAPGSMTGLVAEHRLFGWAEEREARQDGTGRGVA